MLSSSLLYLHFLWASLPTFIAFNTKCCWPLKLCLSVETFCLNTIQNWKFSLLSIFIWMFTGILKLTYSPQDSWYPSACTHTPRFLHLSKWGHIHLCSDPASSFGSCFLTKLNIFSNLGVLLSKCTPNASPHCHCLHSCLKHWYLLTPRISLCFLSSFPRVYYSYNFQNIFKKCISD